MNAPIDTLAFAERFEGVGFGQDQDRVLAPAFGQAQDAGRENLVTKECLDVRWAETKHAIAENGKEITGRLWTAATIIAGVSTAISAVVGAAVALLVRAKGL